MQQCLQSEVGFLLGMQRLDLDLPDFHQKNKKSAFSFFEVAITILNDFVIDVP